MATIQIKDIFLGGRSDSKWYGIPNSIPRIVGFDLHSVPGLLKVNQKMTKETSGVPPDEFCKVYISSSNGNSYWFSSISGKIWQRTSAGTWSLAYTTVPTSGGAGCLGAAEYNGWIIWATQDQIHRIAVVNATGASNWTTYAVPNWQELNLDQTLGGSGATAYTLQTSINEGATHRQTFTALKTPLQSVGVNIASKGTGDWTVSIHDSSNVLIGSKTLTNANVANGFTIFTFTTPLNLITGQSYHIHITVSTGTSTAVSNVNNDSEGANMKTYTTSDDTYHPMREVNLVLYIGDKNLVHQVEIIEDTQAEAFTQDAVDIPRHYRITTLGKLVTQLVLGTVIASNVNECRIYIWNTFSVSFSNDPIVQENGINAFIENDNFLIAQAGNQGNLYTVTSDGVAFYKKIPGNYEPSNTMIVYPNATGIFRGNPIFGISNLSGNPTDQGIWSSAHYSMSYPVVVTLEYPISQLDGDNYHILSNVEIGAIMVSGTTILMSWKDSTGSPVSGIDKLDASNKILKPFLESRVIAIDRRSLQILKKIWAHYETLPANTNIYFKIESNHSGTFSTAATTINDATRMQVYAEDLGDEAKVFRARIECLSVGNNAPTIEEFQIDIE